MPWMKEGDSVTAFQFFYSWPFGPTSNTGQTMDVNIGTVTSFHLKVIFQTSIPAI